MGRKRTKTKLLMCLMAASTIITGILGSVPLSVKAADHEARIGDVYYEDIESAFQNVQAGETITVLKDCSVSETLRVTRDDIILKSENADAPVTVSRDEDFTGKTYGVSGGSVLLQVTGGSLTTRDIIFDGGAVLDDGFNNSGRAWKSALIYVGGTYTMESGTVLQNNYVAEEAGVGLYTAGGLYVAEKGALVMDGGIIQNCYTTGSGGGIQTKEGSQFTATAGAVRNCYGILGGGMNLDGTAELSGMTLSGNKAGSTGGAVYSSAPLTITDSLIKDNESVYDGGGIATATGHTAHITGCTFTGNTAARGSAIQTMEGEGTLPLVIRDCTFTGNPSAGFSHAGGVICYGNETGIVLSGKIVMEDNLTAGVEPCDIHYFYNTGASILLERDFESDSTFVLGGYDTIKPGRVLIDGGLYHKDASTEQFVWHTEEYCTEKKGENIYLAEVPKTYTVRYDANNDSAGTSIVGSDPNCYKSEDTTVIMDREALYSIMGHFINPGYDLVGWNTEPDGTGTDYTEGQEISLTEDLYLYAKWEVKKPVTVTITYIYNNGMEERTDSAQVLPGADIIFPDASRKGYSFKGWYEDEDLTVFAGNAGEEHPAPEKDTTYYAAWEKADAMVTFDADGGKMEGGDVTAKVDDTIALPTCTKEGYEFVGWYDGDTCVGQAGEEYTITGGVTLKAHYVKKETPTCTITFDTNGGKAISSVKVEKGKAVSLPEAEKENHIFLGWYTEKESGEKIGTEFTVTEDITLYAHWEKEVEKPVERQDATISFDADGGKLEGGDITAKVGDTITLPTCTKDGNEFVGWYDNDTCVGQAGEEYTITSDVTLKAHYVKKEIPTCTITFDTNGGKMISPVKVEKGKAVSLPEAEKENHIFLGWYTEQEGGEKIGVQLTVTEDITLYAYWEQKAEKPVERQDATISFDADGGKMEGGDVTAKVGDTITLPACMKEGYEFVGWYDNDTCTGQAGEDYTVTGDVTLKAHYVKKETPTYTITFDTNGGKAISPLKVEKEKTINLPEAEKENHIFLGWYTEQEGGEKIGAQLTVTEDITLYAHWEQKVEKPEERQDATISFDADGGKLEGGDVTAKVGDTITLPACTKDGYEFEGWYDNDICVGQAGEDYTVTGDVILKARYEKKAETTYLITFDPNGGRKAEHIRAAKGEKITLPGTEKTGYIFLGWYTEKDGGILLGIAGDELEVTKDMTVYALWEKEKSEETGDKEPETCKAVFHKEGGKLKNETLTIVKGAGLYLPLPEKKGYDFAGWYLDKSLTQFAGTYRDAFRITKDTDFYAKWEKSKEDDSNHDADQGSNAETKDTYTVKFDANGGTVKESSVKVEKGVGVKLPTAERKGFTFMGWYTDKQVFVGKAGSTYKPDQDITLYAKWEKAAAGDSDGNTGDGTDSATKTGTSAAAAGQDKKTDTSAEKADGTQTGMTGAETQKEPVLQTGRTSPIYLLAAIGMFGVLLAALSIREGKRSSVK